MVRAIADTIRVPSPEPLAGPAVRPIPSSSTTSSLCPSANAFQLYAHFAGTIGYAYLKALVTHSVTITPRFTLESVLSFTGSSS